MRRTRRSARCSSRTWTTSCNTAPQSGSSPIKELPQETSEHGRQSAPSLSWYCPLHHLHHSKTVRHKRRRLRHRPPRRRPAQLRQELLPLVLLWPRKSIQDWTAIPSSRDRSQQKLTKFSSTVGKKRAAMAVPTQLKRRPRAMATTWTRQVPSWIYPSFLNVFTAKSTQYTYHKTCNKLQLLHLSKCRVTRKHEVCWCSSAYISH